MIVLAPDLKGSEDLKRAAVNFFAPSRICITPVLGAVQLQVNQAFFTLEPGSMKPFKPGKLKTISIVSQLNSVPELINFRTPLERRRSGSGNLAQGNLNKPKNKSLTPARLKPSFT